MPAKENRQTQADFECLAADYTENADVRRAVKRIASVKQTDRVQTEKTAPDTAVEPVK